MWSTILSFFTGGTSRLWLYLAAALALSILLGWLFWSRASLKGDLIQAQADVATLQGANRAKAKTIEDMQRISRVTDKALLTREAALNSISADREVLRNQLAEVLNHDPTARAWADSPLPDGVVRLLR